VDDRPVTVYSPASQLRQPRQLLRSLRDDLSASRSVGWRLFLRDLRSQHRRSLLSYTWIVLPPLVSAFVWVFLNEAGVISTSDGDVSYGLFVLIGTSLWQGFVDALNVPFEKLSRVQGMITKYRLPPEALVIVGILEVSFNQAIRLALVLAVFVFSGATIHPTILLVPIGAAALVLLGVQIGSALAPFGALYGDVQRAVQLATLVWFIITPIVYSVDQVGGLNRLNPVAVLLVTTRDWLLTGDTRWPWFFAGTVLVTVLLLPLTLAVYRLVTPHLVDRAAA
jgi:lipopolysaccharide transport system permease protein